MTMILQSDVMGDISFAAHFWAEGKECPESVSDDPALVAWQCEALVRQVFRFLRQAQRTTVHSTVTHVGPRDHWKRMERRWKKIRAQAVRMDTMSDPTLVYFDKIWKKCERLLITQPEKAVEDWLETEGQYWDGLIRSPVSERTEIIFEERTLSPVKALGEDQVGIYNREVNAEKLRQWFHNQFPEEARRWDESLATYWSYCSQVRLFEENPEPRSESLPAKS